MSYADASTLKSYIFTERGIWQGALKTGLKDYWTLVKKTKMSYILMKAILPSPIIILTIRKLFQNPWAICLMGFNYILNLDKRNLLLARNRLEIARIWRLTTWTTPRRALKVYAIFFGIEKNYLSKVVMISVQYTVYGHIMYMTIGEMRWPWNHISRSTGKLHFGNNYRF